MKKNAADIFYFAGVIAICFGVAMFNIPMAMILAGIFCIVTSHFIHRTNSQKGAK